MAHVLYPYCLKSMMHRNSLLAISMSDAFYVCVSEDFPCVYSDKKFSLLCEIPWQPQYKSVFSTSVYSPLFIALLLQFPTTMTK